MKQLAIDLTGLIGLSAMIYGVYLHFGQSIALMVGGALLVFWAILKSKAK